MNENQIIESVNEGVINEVCECTNSKGGLLTYGLIGLAAAGLIAGGVYFFRKRKARKAQNEIVETESNEDYE